VTTSPLKILEFEIASFGYKANGKSKKDYYIPNAKDVTFKVTPYENKKKKNKYRIDFLVFLGKKKSPANLELEGFFIVQLPKKLGEEKISNCLKFAVFPMIFSTLRGYIYAVTAHSPVRIIVPLVNIIKSFDDIWYVEENLPERKSKKSKK